MKCSRFALHGESKGIVRRLPDNVEAGFGPSFSEDPKGPGFVVFAADSHWPQFFLIRCGSVEEAFEHAEICLFDPDVELEELASKCDLNDGSLDELLYANDATLCSDGRIRVTWSLRVLELAGR